MSERCRRMPTGIKKIMNGWGKIVKKERMNDRGKESEGESKSIYVAR